MNNRDNLPFVSRRILVLCAALGCFNIVLCAAISQLITSAVLLAVCFVVAYTLEIAFFAFFYKRGSDVVSSADMYEILKEKSSVLMRNTSSPIIAFDNAGEFLWYNDAMKQLLPKEFSPDGRSVSDIFGLDVRNDLKNERVRLDDREYSVECFVLNEENEERIHLLSLSDITELAFAEEKYNNSRVCVAYIAIDNIEDVLQYVHEKFRVAVSVVDEKLKSWADSMNAIIKSYDNDKYIMFFSSKALDECLNNRFEILDEIRETRVGDGVSITISMGVARSDGTLKERELAARDAIDMALQRGGDQVVYNENGVTKYFGGRTKSIYKRSNVKSRTFTNQLLALMARADNVLIMGHRYGDFDSFGAAVGVARIAMLCGVKVNIAVDFRDNNLAPCISLLEGTELYSQVFVDNADGLDLVGPDTLLVLVDHNMPARSQFADIANKVASIVVLDHHRKNDALVESVKLSYIEPSASSACELVTEMLESALSSQNLLKEEADMLLAGILLDTKQFTRNTGTRTFGAAQYLRGAGANPSDVYTLFKTDPDDLKKEARFHTDITIYRGTIAISCCEGETDESYRIIASKAADKMLTLKGINAAFTLVKIGEHIHISGRSQGAVNVQLILERLNGGGHFDVAGAQVEEDSVISVLETLKESIDDYFDA